MTNQSTPLSRLLDVFFALGNRHVNPSFDLIQVSPPLADATLDLLLCRDKLLQLPAELMVLLPYNLDVSLLLTVRLLFGDLLLHKRVLFIQASLLRLR